MKNLSNSKYSMSSSSVCLCSQSTILATRLKQDQKILKERKNKLQIQKTSSNTCTQARSPGFQSRFSSSCQCHHPLSTGSPPRIENLQSIKESIVTQSQGQDRTSQNANSSFFFYKIFFLIMYAYSCVLGIKWTF